MRFTTFIYKESGNVSGIIFQYNKCCYPFLDFHIKKILKMRKYKKDISKKYLKEIQKIIGVRKELECWKKDKISWEGLKIQNIEI